MSEEFPVYRGPAAREALYRLVPGMLTAILRTPDPDQTLFRLERFLEAVGPRGGYYSMLEENPRTLGHLIEVCEDQEERLARLGVMRVQEMLRIGVGELMGALDPWEEAEELSDLADVLLDLTLGEALRGADQDPSAGPPPVHPGSWELRGQGTQLQVGPGHHVRV